MKNVIMIFAFLLIGLVSYGQSGNSIKDQVINSASADDGSKALVTKERKWLKGPAAKNYKHWKKDNSASSIAVTTSSKPKLMGPAAKNYKPWKDNTVQEEQVVTVNLEKPRLLGPAAKNSKPWTANSEIK